MMNEVLPHHQKKHFRDTKPACVPAGLVQVGWDVFFVNQILPALLFPDTPFLPLEPQPRSDPPHHTNATHAPRTKPHPALPAD